MRTTTSMILVTCLLGTGACAPLQPPSPPRSSTRVAKSLRTWTDRDWRYVLEATVTPDGLVDYNRLVRNIGGARAALDRYVYQIAGTSPEDHPELFPNETDRLAFYLNAYNALAVYGAIEQRLPEGAELASLAARVLFTVGGRSMTLDELQTSFIRPAGDPRTHFALSTLARSSPALGSEPYEGARLDEQLAEQGRRYLASPLAVRAVDEQTVALSELLTRFAALDFKHAYEQRTGERNPSLLEALAPYAPQGSPILAAKQYQTIPFDWSLNVGEK